MNPTQVVLSHAPWTDLIIAYEMGLSAIKFQTITRTWESFKLEKLFPKFIFSSPSFMYLN